jgi:NadR type nicotinamide-nucleotide adenylyltransferase
MPLRIAITGPESSGKTTLAATLAKHYQTAYVEEYARTYLEKYGKEYDFQDLLKIAKRQIQMRERQQVETQRLLFCDTDLVVLKVWAEEKFHRSILTIENTLKTDPCDLYLLCYPDVAWEYDPLRENPDDRHRLFHIYKRYMEVYHLNYHIIEGKFAQRNRLAINIVDSYLREY